ncbi:MAG: hypothetical protein ACKO6Q_07470 [Bacteroidota bacterium]
MRKLIGLGTLLFRFLMTLEAQPPAITIIPLVEGIPLNTIIGKDIQFLANLPRELKDQTLKLLREVDVNPDSCEFISADENSSYSTNIGKMDICYTFCRIAYENGKSKQNISIHYNGFAKELNRPKLHLRLMRSDDDQIQSIILYYYRGLDKRLLKTKKETEAR